MGDNIRKKLTKGRQNLIWHVIPTTTNLNGLYDQN